MSISSIDDSTYEDRFRLTSFDRVSVQNLKDGETILGAKRAALEVLGKQDLTSDANLVGRVSKPVPPEVEVSEAEPASVETVKEEFDRLAPIMAAIQENPENPTVPEGYTDNEVNFVIRIRNLIGEIFVQLNKISERDRFQIDEMKAQYRTSSQRSADLTRTLGDSGFKVSILSFALLLGQFVSPIQADRDIIKFAAEQIPSLGGVFTGRYQASQREMDSLAQLVLAEYNAKTSKSQSEANSKQELNSLFEKVLDSVRRASSST